MALSRIRANVTVTSPTAAVTVSPEGVVGATVGVVQTAATVVIPISAISWINIIYSAEVDYRGMNPVVKEIFVVADASAVTFGKNITESQSAIDAITGRQFGKALADTPALTEITVYSLQRTINELVDATDDFYGAANSDDDQTMFFSKSIPVEAKVASDSNAVDFGKNLAEQQATSEKVTYDASKPLFDSLASSETVGYSYSKPVADLVDATDDFYGLANSDDDQTMFFAKSLPVETQTVSDTDNWAFTKAATEGLNTTESATYSFYKPFSDSPNASETVEYSYQKAVTGSTETQTVSDTDNWAFTKAATEGLNTTESATYAATKALADNPSISEAVGYTYQKAVADTADAGDELNALFVTDDGQTMFMSKNFSEPLSSSDAAANAVGKSTSDYFYTADYLQPFDLGKGLAENAVTSHEVTYTFGKSRVDALTALDSYAFSYTRQPEYDSVNAQREGPNFWDNYVDPTYMASGYAGTGIPAFDVEKAVSDAASNSDTLTYTVVYSRTLSDSVNATDDFDGTATTEDDQTMTFAKGLSDTISHSDAHAFVVGMSREDAATFSDALTDLFGKAVTDSFTKSDLVTASVGKALADSATTSDNITARSFSKALSDLVDATDDFDGAATAEDDQTMSFVTSRAETVSASDSSSQSAGKGLTEPVGTSDSGSLRMTDYCDVLYFTDVYVGISATF
jgi:hypothetical protein